MRLTIQSIAPYTIDITGSGLPTGGGSGAADFTGTITSMRFKTSGNLPDNPSFTLDLGDTPISFADFMANPLPLFAGNDTFIGGPVANTFYGYGGNDTLDGGNTLTGIVLNDTLYGGDGDDTFIIREQTDPTKYDPAIYGGAGIDTMTINWANVGPNAFLQMSRYTVAPSSIERLSFSYVAVENGVEVTRDADVFGRSDGTLFNGPGLTAIHGVGRLRVGSFNLSGVDVTTLNDSFTLYGGNFFSDTLMGARSFGANTTEISYFGFGGNDTLGGGASSAIESLFGGADNDTYIPGAGDVVVELANQGTDTLQRFITTNLNDFANVENLTLLGTAAVNATGTEGSNIITGNAGANVLNGSGGTDTLQGLGGNDTYEISAGVTISEEPGGGFDTVLTTATTTLAAQVEALVLQGPTAINGTGNSIANRITGNEAANVLDGADGIDTLIGGLGDDIYVVTAGDVVTEGTGGGLADRVRAAATYVLAAGVQVEVLETSLATATATIALTGNATSQAIIGNDGINVLTGGGGTDTLTGGLGNDTYIVEAGDMIVEGAGGGLADRVRVAASYSLVAGVSAEVLETILATATTTIALTGNAVSQAIIGNAGVNVLTGGGGTDTLTGGQGSDTYVVEVGDVIVEGAGSGTDRVRVAASYTLAAGAAIEVLETRASTGFTAINLTGNDAFQTLVGNAADNILNGGEGADTMIGGLGDDTFIVDDQGDEVTEGAGGGTLDTVRTSVNFALASGVNVEVLAAAAGTAAIILTGNALAQTVRGNGGANVLNGLSGTDTLTGGSGADAFVFSAALATIGTDVITDFSRAMDIMHLDRFIFGSIGQMSGGLFANRFRANTTGLAGDTDDRIIYETDTGILRYDSNGSASGGTIVQFARLQTPLALDHTDFMVI